MEYGREPEYGRVRMFGTCPPDLAFRPRAPDEGKMAHDAETRNLRNLQRALVDERNCRTALDCFLWAISFLRTGLRTRTAGCGNETTRVPDLITTESSALKCPDVEAAPQMLCCEGQNQRTGSRKHGILISIVNSGSTRLPCRAFYSSCCNSPPLPNR